LREILEPEHPLEPLNSIPLHDRPFWNFRPELGNLCIGEPRLTSTTGNALRPNKLLRHQGYDEQGRPVISLLKMPRDEKTLGRRDCCVVLLLEWMRFAP